MSVAPESRTVLIADDFPGDVDLMIDALRPICGRVLVAGDGAEALMKYRAESPDLVVLDVQMPKLTGIEVCRWIKERTKETFLPVLLVTERNDSSDKMAGLEAGADDYLLKPLVRDELQARARAMFRIRALYQESLDANAELARMTGELQRRALVQAVEVERTNRLRRYLPPSLVERVLSNPEDDPLVMVPRRREVTVVFSDIRNFTQIADQLEPDEVRSLLAEYLGAMNEAVFQYEGSINKFMGDGVMVVFGDMFAQPDHALRALRAALEMCDRAKALEATLHTILPEPFAIGIGIHTGLAIVGNVGTGAQLDYTVIGSTVNLASRLQNLSPNNVVVASEATFGPLREQLELREERRETIRSFAHPVRIAEVVAIRG